MPELSFSRVMKVTVLFFGATADVAGKHSEEVEVPKNAQSREAFDLAIREHPSLASHKLLFSVNQEYANGIVPVKQLEPIVFYAFIRIGPGAPADGARNHHQQRNVQAMRCEHDFSLNGQTEHLPADSSKTRRPSC